MPVDLVLFVQRKEEKKLVSEQAPPKKVKKTKTKTVVSLDQKKEKIDNQSPEAVPLPDKTVKKIETKKENKQNPDKLDEEVKQVSEFEKKEFVDLDNIAKLIDKAKEDTAELIKKNNDITQDQDKNIVTSGLTLSEEDALKAQIFGCWSIPLGLPYNEDLLVRIKLMLEPDGSVSKLKAQFCARDNKQLEGIDLLIFDIQDVGARFYTYISSLHYLMEACAENDVKVLVLDRPNPNGDIVDGNVLDMDYSSFVGKHAIPILHGMTVGEYAQMINGEHWLSDSILCELEVISCEQYTHKDSYSLPIKPSPKKFQLYSLVK